MIRRFMETFCLILSCSVVFQVQSHLLKGSENSFPAEIEEQRNQNAGCNISAGWNLTGRDWGCCGNYEGCCKLASKLCYLHDRVCHCCTLGWFLCGPECTPDSDCLANAPDVKPSISDLIMSFSSPNPLTSSTLQNKDTNVSKELSQTLSNNSTDFAYGNITSEEQSVFNSFTSQAPSQTKLDDDSSNQPESNKYSVNSSKTSHLIKDVKENNLGQISGIADNDFEFSKVDPNTIHSDIIEGSGDTE
ncbi:uncharacterized protein LOC111110749 isoform X2 [Crassostrea virginica]